MRRRDVELWAIRQLESYQAAPAGEDSRVELKRDQIPAKAAARRLAGHANAANGEPILWLIGVGDGGEVIGLSDPKTADWMQAIHACFDGPCPEICDIVIPWQGKLVLALGIETMNAPFVVRNAVRASREDGPAEYEVPFRRGTAVHSATRIELLRILQPAAQLPELETLDASCQLGRTGTPTVLRSTVFLVTQGRDPVVFPFHKCQASIDIPRFVTWERLLTFRAITPMDVRDESLYATPTELVVRRAGSVKFEATAPGISGDPPGIGSWSMTLCPMFGNTALRVSGSLQWWQDTKEFRGFAFRSERVSLR